MGNCAAKRSESNEQKSRPEKLTGSAEPTIDAVDYSSSEICQFNYAFEEVVVAFFKSKLRPSKADFISPFQIEKLEDRIVFRREETRTVDVPWLLKKICDPTFVMAHEISIFPNENRLEVYVKNSSHLDYGLVSDQEIYTKGEGLSKTTLRRKIGVELSSEKSWFGLKSTAEKWLKKKSKVLFSKTDEKLENILEEEPSLDKYFPFILDGYLEYLE
ncbi:Oidioi.mRNA.OKI2018_I69.PAR.g13083.t1.cds [Oikopleura dioica]|uniref:Oidioi.mRNA.OKI2018_I69.PAR.g13083.t1.cds n=1 Tax=Oikopleura dioica TaxID=34765 RepID=A0ABN7S9Z5_OIKDI|nr:Oidioi.mRNA.OKI2018_I69.PAR.g13083.t1.cds [Oikopleura dioica]